MKHAEKQRRKHQRQHWAGSIPQIDQQITPEHQLFAQGHQDEQHSDHPAHDQRPCQCCAVEQFHRKPSANPLCAKDDKHLHATQAQAHQDVKHPISIPAKAQAGKIALVEQATESVGQRQQHDQFGYLEQ